MIWMGGWRHGVVLTNLNTDVTKIEALIHISIILKRFPKLLHAKTCKESCASLLNFGIENYYRTTIS